MGAVRAGLAGDGAGLGHGQPHCGACAVGSFSTSVNAPSCTTWTTCVAGQNVGAAGSTTVDQLCTACVGGFSTTTNAASCTAWSSCSLDTYEFTAPSVTVDRVCRNYTSCLDRLTRVPATVTGSYVIDADGPGGTAPFTVTCDMTTAPGGWTVISFEDFTTSSLGWSDARRDTSSSCFTAQGAMLGGYGVFGSTATSSKTYTFFGVTHAQVRVALDYFVIDTWDNEFGRVSVDGTQVFNGQFNQGGPNVCGGATGDRWSQPVLTTQPHTTNTMTLNVTSTLDQAANDESFGVDNVSVMIR